jgi:hypothetical protein
MSVHRRRIDTMRALIAGNSAISGSPARADIDAEFEEAMRARAVWRKRRRQLLQVLHSTRALDSALKTFTTHYGFCPPRPALGRYLHALGNHTSTALAGRLSLSERGRFQASIVNPRNRLMHEAGAYPLNDTEVLTLLSEMQDCLTIVVGL